MASDPTPSDPQNSEPTVSGDPPVGDPPVGGPAVSAPSVADLRLEINAIDLDILEALRRRREVALRVVEAKLRSGASLRDVKREEDMLGRLMHEGRAVGLPSDYVQRVFWLVIEESIRTQQEHLLRLTNGRQLSADIERIAYLGAPGSFSHAAALRYLARGAHHGELIGLATFDDIFSAVATHECQLGVVPIENTTSGAIAEVYELLARHELYLVGEERVAVDHCLVAAQGANLDTIRHVVTHAQPARQCSRFLAARRYTTELVGDTVTAARLVAERLSPDTAAIASSEAASLFDLQVLARGIANQRENFTRFVLLSRRPLRVDLRIPAKSSLAFTVQQRPGALVDALVAFRDHGINVTRLESRPVADNPWEELFHVDVEGNIEDPRVMAALDALAASTHSIRVFGTYPSVDLPPSEPTAGAHAEG